MAPLKVIIVGGSIVGLALANMLEQYGIDFILLEKHDRIAPSLGAGFAIWPHAARVLDQLGCYDAFEKVNAPTNYLKRFDENGAFGGAPRALGEWLDVLFGYKMRFMERKNAVQTLFDNLRNKSKVHTSTGVVKIDCHPDGATVETTDGAVFHGDIVIGADGVHSRVRLEMQQLAEKDLPGTDLFPEKDAFKSTWSGLFGVSNTTLGMEQDEAFVNSRSGRSYLCARGPNGTMYWILFFKNEKQTQGSSIPRYTEENREKLVAQCENDVLKPGFTFGDLYKAHVQSSIVPLEEGVLKTCFYRRVVLVGDSWHKVHPISGLGGNHGIMSAAALANELKSLAELEENPNEESLRRAFSAYQKDRGSLVQRIVDLSHTMQRLDALDTWLMRIIQKHLAPRLAVETIQSSFAKILNPATRLKYLPLPSRRGHLGFMDEVKIEPTNRSRFENWFWIVTLALVALAFYPFQGTSDVTGSTEWGLEASAVHVLDTQRAMQLYSNLSLSVVLSIICVESYRNYFSLQLLSSVLPFSIASLFIGWNVLLPIYFSLFILSTAVDVAYFPSPRALDLAMVKALPLAYFVTYIGPTIGAVASPESSNYAWTISHASLPIVLWLSRRLISWLFTPGTGLKGLYGNKDIRAVTNFFLGVSALQGAFSRWISLKQPSYTLNGLGRLAAPQQATAVTLDAVILVFVIFSYWDLRRVKIITNTYYPELLGAIIVTLGVSPATTLGLLWVLREWYWEEARGRRIESKEV